MTPRQTTDARTSSGPADVSAHAEQRLHQLSPRQRQVLELLATGASAKAIGEHLGIKTATVKHHLSFAYHKLGVSNRVEATRVYMLATPHPALPVKPSSPRRRS